jgi:hypothetical protein
LAFLSCPAFSNKHACRNYFIGFSRRAATVGFLKFSKPFVSINRSPSGVVATKHLAVPPLHGLIAYY